MTWVALDGGQLAIGHRPKLRALPALTQEGATHVWTLLSEAEGAPDIGAAVKKAGMQWIWFPLESGDPLRPEQSEKASVLFQELRCVLQGGGKVYAHCSAGIHRTGMMVNGLLRSMGLSKDEARETLQRLRPITFEGVGEHRLAWGDLFAATSS